MLDARYFPARARRCLDVANQLSDSQAAGELRRHAAQYHARAVALETDEMQSREAVQDPALRRRTS